jgi:hypothetical protein
VVTLPLLVAFGSKRGSTQEVAEAIALKLREDGREVELQRAAQVEDLTPYDGVVLGGALYFGRWHKDAARFLSKHRQKLSELPVAVFALGPQTAELEDLANRARSSRKRCIRLPRSSLARWESSVESSIRPSSDSRSVACLRATRVTGTRSIEWASDVAKRIEPHAPANRRS